MKLTTEQLKTLHSTLNDLTEDAFDEDNAPEWLQEYAACSGPMQLLEQAIGMSEELDTLRAEVKSLKVEKYTGFLQELCDNRELRWDLEHREPEMMDRLHLLLMVRG